MLWVDLPEMELLCPLYTHQLHFIQSSNNQIARFTNNNPVKGWLEAHCRDILIKVTVFQVGGVAFKGTKMPVCSFLELGP